MLLFIDFYVLQFLYYVCVIQVTVYTSEKLQNR